MKNQYKGHKVQPVKEATGSYSLLIDGEIQFHPESSGYYPRKVWTFKTREIAKAVAKQLIDAQTWESFCSYNTAHGHPESNTREIYAEWCADREAEGWISALKLNGKWLVRNAARTNKSTFLQLSWSA